MSRSDEIAAEKADAPDRGVVVVCISLFAVVSAAMFATAVLTANR